jgi:hypothetical protein
MLKVNKLVLGIVVSVFIIVAWGLFPAIIKNEEIMNSFWYIGIWVLLFLLPFIVVFGFLRKSMGGLLGGFFGGGKDRKRILSEGRSAEGEIIAIGENSGGGIMTINDQPVVNLRLRIHDGNKPPYEVSFDTVISRLAVPQFQPGVRIPVKIDPLDPNKVIIDSQREPDRPVYGNVGSAEDVDRIKTKGKKGTAKIISVEDTGKSKDFNTIVKMILEVSGPDIKKYSFEKEVPVPTNVAKMFVPGKTFTCVVDPENPESVMLDMQ